ncbi:MAG: NAD(P)/FAD-dependent oxidoreductase [Candidatus Poribacteria bacterium]
MSWRNLQLKNGSKIAIIGAGPAGSFFAHFAVQFARQRNIDVEITIFDGKDFVKAGPAGCNMCAGVISETLVNKLEEEGIFLPEGLVQRKVQGYYLQTRTHAIRLSHPEGAEKITTVFRGNGPRFSTHNGNISFDDFLLQRTKAQGVLVIQEPVQKLVLPPSPTSPASLFYGRTNPPTEFKADLIVGAFGLNTMMLRKVEALDFGYKPPKVVKVCQADMAFPFAKGAEASGVGDNFQNHIVAIILDVGAICFAAITPKERYITISLLGKTDLRREDLIQFLSSRIARRWLGEDFSIPKQFCQCLPKIAISPSKQPFTDRLVIIGDAAFSRYYKNGLESAFITAKLAAEAAFFDGISRSAFRKNYLKKAQKLIVRDNRYGRFLFGIHYFICKNDFLTEVFSLATEERKEATAKQFRLILWNMLTGNVPYRRIFFDCFKMFADAKLLEILRKNQQRKPSF